MNKDIMRNAGWGTEVARFEQGHCPLCNSAIDMADFKTELDLKEYNISGMCQSCQDKTFDNIAGWRSGV